MPRKGPGVLQFVEQFDVLLCDLHMLFVVPVREGATLNGANLLVALHPVRVVGELVLALLSDPLQFFEVRLVEPALKVGYIFCW